VRHQSTDSQKGEIEFRRKLVEQQIEGKYHFDDEYDAGGIEQILNERMEKTVEKMTELQKRGVRLSPYIEIGAERGQRSLIMENDFNAVGAAVDISFDMLKACDYYKVVLKKRKVPLRICCDANNLPFSSNSIPFAYCYETLHHFPDLLPIIEEIHRVLTPGGYFLFDEEPFKKMLHLDLYQEKKIHLKETENKGTIRKLFDQFFLVPTCNEIEFGIIERDDIPISNWKNALSLFEQKDVLLLSVKGITTDLFKPESLSKYILSYLWGGGISGLCRKTGDPGRNIQSICDILICPACRDEKRESTLVRGERLFQCEICAKRFPVIDGVAFLFSYEKLEELYPEVFESIGGNSTG
jgi:ubiquinone/menaquinone biosynthesis C-methylase UbiE/uncharacterized protein YbaR (Trm112 family)